MNSKWKTSRATLALLFVLTTVGNGWGHIPMPPKKGQIGRQQVNTPVANFALIDQDGRPFELARTRGQLVLATFAFTYCPDICPLFTAKLAVIQRKLKEQGIKNIHLLFITTDPDRDTSARLKEYAVGYRVDFSNWSFLTGSKSELKKVWADFGVNVTQFSDNQIQHTGLATIIDQQGQRRVNFWGEKWLERDVLRDIARLHTKGQKK